MNIVEQLKSILDYSIFNLTVYELSLFFLVLFIFLFFKKIFTNSILLILKKLAERTKTDIDDKLLNILERPIKFLFVTIGLYFAFSVLSLPAEANDLIGHIIRSFIIFVVFWTLYRGESLLNTMLYKVFIERKLDMATSLIPFINKFIKATIICFAITFIIQEWGYDIGAIITGLGIGGLAIALAAKDTLANFFGSVMVLLDKPFKIGDWIVCSDAEGIVEEIGFRSTKIRTFAKALVAIPNSKLANDSITNWSRRENRRINFNIGLTYSTNRSQIENIVNKIRDMLINHKYIKEDPLMVNFTDFGASSLNVFIYCFTTTAVWSEYLKIKEDVNLKIMKIIEDENASFAFPSTSIYVEKLPKNN
ncbi:MAG: mechanosensitive ion channel family protein [Deferribacterota bacterium]|nr:mechanosensitive ion channel family protein [Deferribacterota bacterium]